MPKKPSLRARRNQQSGAAPDRRASRAAAQGAADPGRSYGRRRALCLILVHVLFVIHIVHWRLAGRTLAPLELNEVMYTLEIGIVTAGFVFMAVACLATLIFGRFFCSWGCHILALQDLCAWLLAKLRIRPRPIRSRTLVFVAPIAMLYMFVWPQITRLLDGRPMPILHLRGDGEGWASFVTGNFWRNLPGPGVAMLTFLICGFAIVYVLGARSFCAYICPYGAAFGLADRLAPGRIVARGDCSRCGLCTAVCQSRVRVHEEASLYGRVVNPACLKDLDCVAVCPDKALAYGLARPPAFDFLRRPRLSPKAYDFTLAEDVALGAVFLATFFVFRGLYERVPFLMTLGLSAILGALAVLWVRLVRAPHVRLANLHLKTGGRLTGRGRVFAALCAGLLLLTLHSGFIRFEQFRGGRAMREAARARAANDLGSLTASVNQALTHFSICERWGLYRPPELLHRMGSLHLELKNHEAADEYLARAFAESPDDQSLRHDYASARFALGQAAAQQGDLHRATIHFRKAAGARPDVPEFHYNLAVMLSAAGRLDEAIESYRASLRLSPEDVDTLNNLGLALAQCGRLDDALVPLRRAVIVRPDAADPHFNLGRVLAMKGQEVEAAIHLARAGELNPAYEAYRNEVTRSATNARGR